MDLLDYEPIDLERPAFRLLQLFKGEGPDIECILYQAFLNGDDTVPYHALSYTWGGTDKTFVVNVNGKTLDVTENLYLALQHLRRNDVDLTLWVDAICIDQGNTRERGHQVQQMCEIYSRAEEVIVWLGQATDETDNLMDSLRQMEEYSLMYEHRNWNLAQWSNFWLTIPQKSTAILQKGLGLLLKRSWFRRVWILQEVANAKKASVWCGTKSIKTRTFALAPSLVGMKPERHCQAVLDIMPGHLREESWWSENRDLYNLLLKFSESEASDSRDKVYALLGISTDAWDTDSLRPDYERDLQEVIHSTSSFLFGSSDISCETMPELLENLTSLNAAAFCKLVETSDVSEVGHFLMARGPELSLSEDMIKAAAGNEENGRDIISLLLQQPGSEIKVTEGVIKAAAGNKKSGKVLVGYMHALLEAFSGGYEVAVKMLLNECADIDPRNTEHDNSNVLYTASAAGHMAVVKLLLDKGTNPDAQGEFYGSALQAASSKGCAQVVRLLLDKGADVNARGGLYGNALQAASFKGFEQVIRLLLDKGADVNARGGLYGNALQAASADGYEQVARLLLDKGADVNAQGGHYGNALQAASSKGCEQVVRLLLDRGATKT